jgi:acyl carrier protein
MTPDEIRSICVRELAKIAPDAREHLDPGADLREELDLDSMDFLRFVTGLHDALGIDIPERDYRELASLDAAVAYLATRTSG